MTPSRLKFVFFQTDAHTMRMLKATNLSQHLLLAAPDLDDPFFRRSVIYIDHHDEHGAKGYVINQPMGVSMAELFDKLDIPPEKTTHCNMANAPVLMGGPEEQSSGYVLYSNPKPNASIIEISSSMSAIEDIVNNQGPSDYRVMLGCCNWITGQLEQEVSEGDWIVIPLQLDLLFHPDLSTSWQRAYHQLGIQHSWSLARTSGRA